MFKNERIKSEYPGVLATQIHYFNFDDVASERR